MDGYPEKVIIGGQEDKMSLRESIKNIVFRFLEKVFILMLFFLAIAVSWIVTFSY